MFGLTVCMFVRFRDEVREAMTEALAEAGLNLDPGLERPPQDTDADLASTAAFEAEGNPVEAAQDISAHLHIGDQELIGGVTVEGPYINFRVSTDYLASVLEAAQSDDYPSLPEKDEKVLLEHTSANPTGPLHVGRARNPVIGDSLARILREAGYDVEVEYYVNDMGRQVATITWALNHFTEDDVPEGERDKPDYDVVRYYRRANEVLEGDDELAQRAEAEIDDLLRALEEGEEDALGLVSDAVDRCLEGQLESLERLGSDYDSFVRESRFVLEGEVDEVAERLMRDDRCYMEEDAYKLDLRDYDIDKELVFLRSDGTSLYTTRDIAYHLDKFRRCDRAVNVLGEDHKLQSRQLAAALDVLGVEDRPDNVFYSYVNLPEGKMSTREGTVVNMDDLLDEAVARARREIEDREEDRDRDIESVEETAEMVGIGAVRFDIAARQPEKPITFRWEEALDFEGQHAPSIQYVHARASGILERADTKPGVDLNALDHEAERRLLRKIGLLSLAVEEAAGELSPHRIATYSRELAEVFNEFYRECHVLVDDEEVRGARLALTRAARNSIASSLGLLGVEAPDAM